MLSYNLLSLLLLVKLADCNLLLNLLRTLQDNWQLEDVTVVYTQSLTVPERNNISIPAPADELNKMGVSFFSSAELDLSGVEDTVVLLAMPPAEIRALLLKIFKLGTTVLTDTCRLLLPVEHPEDLSLFTSEVYIPIYTQVFAALVSSDRLRTTTTLLELYHVTVFYHGVPYGPPLAVEVRPGTQVPFRDHVLWRRRGDLKGVVLTAGTKPDAPQVIIHSWTPTVVSGYFPQVWRELERTLNFTTRYEAMPQITMGYKTATGTWSGLIGRLQRGEVDVAVAGVTVSAGRMQVVDFTRVVYRISYKVYFRKYIGLFPVDSISFVSPAPIIMFLTATVVISSTVQVAIARMGEERRTCAVAAIVFYSLSAFCQQGTSSERIPKCTSGRVALWVTYFSGLIVFNIFSATLLSRLAVCFNNAPFNSLTGLVATGSYTLGGRRGTADGEVLLGAHEGVATSHVWLNETNFPLNNQDGIDRVCNERFAFLTPYNIFDNNYHSSFKPACIPHHVTLKNVNDHLSIALAKNLPYRRLFNFYLRKMRESGVLDRLEKTWYPTFPEESVPVTSVKMIHIAPLMFWVVLYVTASACLLLIERFVYGRKT